MKNVVLYLKSRIKVIVMLVVIAIVQFVVFYLYSVPVAPVIYSLELLSFMLAVAVVFDYMAFYRRHKALKHSLLCDEIFQVEKIVRKAVKKFAAQFIGKKISIELNNLDTNVKTDEKWLGFIIEQLISNAVKYTRNGGKISIYMKETFNSADRILVIEDNGIGITKEDIPRIFERGYTGYNGRMSKKSSGIGLYLCRKAADKLGISIAIESKLDKGTKVLLDMTQKYISHE